MNIQEIDKWLDNEYGVSYTRLEELHDFVVEQDFKHQEKKDKEIETLKQELQRKDNIINELKEWAEKQFLMETPLYGCVFKSMLDKIEVLENDN